jgi:hypothetical protein
MYINYKKIKETFEMNANTSHTHNRESSTDASLYGYPYNQFYEFRSRTELFGLPLIHIVHGIDPAIGRFRVACGIIAIGDVAIGGIAVGGISFGLLSLGGISIGLFTLGAIALGAWAAGGVAVGAVAAIGAIAVSLKSALGLLAISLK